MNTKTPRAGAAALELLLVVALAAVVLFGLVRTVLSPVALGGHVPDGVRSATEHVLGIEYLGASPSVRAELARNIEVRTTPRLYFYGAEEIPNGRGEFSGPYEAQVNEYSPSTKQKVALLGSALTRSVAAILGLVLALRVVRTLRQGDPFVLVNARRLRLIAGLVVIGGFGGAALRAWAEHLVLADRVIAPLVRHTYQLSLWPFAAGLGVWLLAEVFRRGALMRDDLEGLV